MAEKHLKIVGSDTEYKLNELNRLQEYERSKGPASPTGAAGLDPPVIKRDLKTTEPIMRLVCPMIDPCTREDVAVARNLVTGRATGPIGTPDFKRRASIPLPRQTLNRRTRFADFINQVDIMPLKRSQ